MLGMAMLLMSCQNQEDKDFDGGSGGNAGEGGNKEEYSEDAGTDVEVCQVEIGALCREDCDCVGNCLPCVNTEELYCGSLCSPTSCTCPIGANMTCPSVLVCSQ